MREDWHEGGFGLYVHWPFCAAKCPYCDFNSHVRQTVDHPRWQKSLISELRYVAELTPGRVLNSIFFGGGTPSLMQPETTAALIETAGDVWEFAEDIEITLEANPTSVEMQTFKGFQSAGINRVSIGIQALNNQDLKALGRLHTVKEALQALENAQKYFNRVSFDLIYARQNQTLGDWDHELTQALGYATDHLSLYQLTIEPQTRFGDLYNQGKLKDLPSEDLAADLYLLTQDICASHGLPAYEISNHARPGAQSRHNLIYWRYGDYAGIGPGAHGRFTSNGVKHATETPRSPERWLKTVEQYGHSIQTTRGIPTTEQAEEYLMMALRLTEGADINRFERLARWALKTEKITDFINQGFLTLTNHRLCATNTGRLVLNKIIEDLLI